MNEPPQKTIALATLPAVTSDHTPAAAGSAPLPAAPSGERYRLLEELAGGGMGIIYRAIDTALSREVAIKVLRERFGSGSSAASRFADEARITAQLQHPAIPPVHDIGTLPDGRPFLAMKLIKGQTLEDLLASRPDPSAERGRFLAAFEQVCQAVAYAHAHEVIHRDLKPANIMVGAFGEVQVMDWGLAKVLTSRQSQGVETDPRTTRADSEVVSLRDSDGSFTQAGSVLGTPAFMPPEQAVGAVGKVDQRSDVFGLGAILAVILTGQPPFAKASLETIRVKAAQGDVSECFALLDGCGAEPELVALCKRCLHPKRAERPADGGEVARSVAGLRQEAEERARQAEVERVRAEGERLAAVLRAAEERKRRRVQRALAVAVGLLLVGGTAFGWRHAEQGRVARERLARNAEAVAGLLHQCEQALRSGDAAAAKMLLEAAQTRAAEGGVEDQSERLVRCRDDLAVLRDLDAVDRFRWTPIDGKRPPSAAVVARYHEALGRFGADPDAVGAETAAQRVAGSAVRERLVAALDRLLWGQKSAAVRATLELIDPDAFRAAVRDAAQSKDGTAALMKLVSQDEALAQPSGFAAVLGDEGTIDAPERQRQLLRAALQRRPGDLGLLMALGRSYSLNRREGAEEQLRWFQAAVAAAPANPVAHLDLGIALANKGELEEALGAYREAIRLDPQYAMAYNNLGVILKQKKDVNGAIAAYQEALRLDPRCALVRTNLGAALQSRGDLNGAIAAWKEAIRIDPTFAKAHNNLGRALYGKKDVDGAIAAYKEAIRLDPKYALAHNNLGSALQSRRDLDGAAAAYKEAIRNEPRFAMAHRNLGLVLRLKGDLEGAIAAYKEAIRIDPQYAEAYIGLGNALKSKRDPDGAIAAYTEALRLHPTDALAHNNLGAALQVKGDLARAIAAYQEAIRLDPQLAIARRNLERVQRQKRLNSLPDVLAGKYKPTSAVEYCEFALLCVQPGEPRYCDAARLFESAFAADASLAEDLKAGHRYNAACCAALAGCGKGTDAAKLKDKDKAQLRAKALHWLRADLTLYQRQADVARLSWWLEDSDLASLRPGPERVEIPREERAAWDRLWADVRATLALAQKTPTPSTANKSILVPAK